MKTYPKLALAAIAALISMPPVSAQPQAAAEVPQESKAPAKLSRHLRICAMLGLKPDVRYEFQLTGNQFRYYEIRSLGADGWILTKGFNYPDAWLNLSQVISVTPVPIKSYEPRPKKVDQGK